MTSSEDVERVGIYGFGRDGRSIHRYLRRRDPSLPIAVLLDGDAPEELDALCGEDPATTALTGPAAHRAVESGDLTTIVRSPGVSIRTGPLRDVAPGTEVLTSIGLALRDHRPDRVVGVTGTKGKSTTSTMAGLLLRELGLDVAVCGNIGTPILDLVDRFDDLDVVVVELSSYVLADLDASLDVGVLLNLHPEHPEWHGDVDTYFADKCRITTMSDALVANGDDPRVRDRAPSDAAIFRRAGDRWDLGAATLPHRRLVDELATAGVHGNHLVIDLAAALTVVAVLGHDPADALPGIRRFEALPHRLRTVHDDGTLLWVDDSISTIPETAVAAIDVFDGRPIALIAGGHDRGQDHAPLVERIARSTVRTVVTLPDTGARLAEDLRAAELSSVEVVETRDLAEAVTAAAVALRPEGGVVILSPAAPSYGHFTDFIERGERFAELARRI